MQHHVLTRFAALSSGELGRATRPVKRTSTVTKRTLRRNCGAMASSTKGNTQVFPETEQVADAMADLTLRARKQPSRSEARSLLRSLPLDQATKRSQGKKDVDWKNCTSSADERCVLIDDPRATSVVLSKLSSATCHPPLQSPLNR